MINFRNFVRSVKKDISLIGQLESAMKLLRNVTVKVRDIAIRAMVVKSVTKVAFIVNTSYNIVKN